MEHVSTLEQILDAREQRAARQALLAAAYPGCTVVSLTVNVPGPVKRPPWADRVFWAGLEAVKKELALAGIAVPHWEILQADTGNAALLLAAADPLRVKKLTCEVENRRPWGRALDADVLGPKGGPLSRADVSLAPRGCVVCGEDCRTGQRRHSLSEILGAYERLAATLEE